MPVYESFLTIKSNKKIIYCHLRVLQTISYFSFSKQVISSPQRVQFVTRKLIFTWRQHMPKSIIKTSTLVACWLKIIALFISIVNIPSDQPQKCPSNIDVRIHLPNESPGHIVCIEIIWNMTIGWWLLQLRSLIYPHNFRSGKNTS